MILGMDKRVWRSEVGFLKFKVNMIFTNMTFKDIGSAFINHMMLFKDQNQGGLFILRWGFLSLWVYFSIYRWEFLR